MAASTATQAASAVKGVATDAIGHLAGYVAKTRIDVLLKIMKAVNILNGLLGVVACGFAFSIAGGSLQNLLLSFYIGIFALLLLSFELRLPKTEPIIKKFFGFMYTYGGRTAFLMFVGAINFGLIDSTDSGTTGHSFVLAMGLVTVVNALFNCFVICNHPAFKEQPPQPGGPLSEKEVMAYLQANPQFAQQALRGDVVTAPQAPQAPVDAAPLRADGQPGYRMDTLVSQEEMDAAAARQAAAAAAAPKRAPAPKPTVSTRDTNAPVAPPAAPVHLKKPTGAAAVPPPVPARTTASVPRPAPASAPSHATISLDSSDNPFE